MTEKNLNSTIYIQTTHHQQACRYGFKLFAVDTDGSINILTAGSVYFCRTILLTLNSSQKFKKILNNSLKSHAIKKQNTHA